MDNRSIVQICNSFQIWGVAAHFIELTKPIYRVLSTSTIIVFRFQSKSNNSLPRQITRY